MDREIRSIAKSFLDSRTFYPVFRETFRPQVDLWTNRLLHEEDLPPDERKAIVIAMRELYNCFVGAYTICDLEVPEWLNQEFHK